MLIIYGLMIFCIRFKCICVFLYFSVLRNSLERKLKKNVWKIIVRTERKVKKERVKEEIRMSDDNDEYFICLYILNQSFFLAFCIQCHVYFRACWSAVLIREITLIHTMSFASQLHTKKRLTNF